MSLSVEKAAQADRLVASAREVLETMAGVAIRSISVDDPPTGSIQADVVGSIGITGSHSGVFALSASLATARGLCAALLSIDEADIEDMEEVADAFGELTNMVCGGFKTATITSEPSESIALALPVVTFGAETVLAAGGPPRPGASATVTTDDGELKIDLLVD